MKITTSIFGMLPDGTEVSLFELETNSGATVSITNYGAIITSITTPDRMGKSANIVCGFNKLEHYLAKQYLDSYPYFGCVCGRVCNRIAKGKFMLEGVNYSVAVNNGPNHLHGGLVGFDKKVWNAEVLESDDKAGIMLTYTSPDREENYPGNLEVGILYALNNENELSIDYFAKTDKTTILNLTNHTYFNLTGSRENILNHELLLSAAAFTESVDMIPTGKILPVEQTPFDFTSFKTLKQDISKVENGYDLNFVLDNEVGNLVFAGCLAEKKSGRQVEVYTTQPGIQLYTGFWIPEIEIDGKKCFGSFSGVALETQHYPDSVNHAGFPAVILKPGEHFQQQTIYKFGLIEE